MYRVRLIMVAGITLLSQAAWGASARVDYGTVTDAKQVDLSASSNTAATVGGALAGGTVGYVFGKGSSAGKKRRSMIGGAAIGGLVGNQATKGTNKGFAYTVKLLDGSSVTITTEQGQIDVGDCVTVERGESANIRRVSQVHCQSRDATPSAEHLKEAGECEAAKAAMLNAETSDALEAAVRKARLLCEE